MSLRIRKKRSVGSFRSAASFSASIAGSLSSRVNTPIQTATITIIDTNKNDRRDLPPWDRTVDVVYHQHRKGERRPGKNLDWERTLTKFRADHKYEGPKKDILPGYFRLPAGVRLQICQHVMAEEVWSHRAIGLNDRAFDREVWPPGYFADLGDVLLFLKTYEEVSPELHTEMLLAILTTSRFHVTFSPFVERLLSPVETNWIRDYGQYMQHVALELDMSRFGLGPGGSKAAYAPGTPNVGNLVRVFVEEQLKRKGHSTMEAFVILCRQFYGDRPAYVPEELAAATTSMAAETEPSTPPSSSMSRSSNKGTALGSLATALVEAGGKDAAVDKSQTGVVKTTTQITISGYSMDAEKNVKPGRTGSTTKSSLRSNGQTSEDSTEEPKGPLPPVSYCSQESLAVCDPLLKLDGLVDSVRICGFGEGYTHKLLTGLFKMPPTADLKHYSYRVAPSTLWPRLHGQKSWVDIGNSQFVLDNHVLPGPEGLLIHPTGPIIPAPPTVDLLTGDTSVPNLGIVDVNDMKIPELSDRRGRWSFTSSEGETPKRSKSKVRIVFESLKKTGKSIQDLATRSRRDRGRSRSRAREGDI